MLRIYVVRHGQDEDNAQGILNGRRDMPLTTVGKNQILDLAKQMKNDHIFLSDIYCAPLRRTLRSASIIASVLGAGEPKILDSLIERDFGVMTGRRTVDIESCCEPEIIKTEDVIYFLSPPGAETFPQLLARAETVLRTIREQHPDGDILLVTSGDIGKMIYAVYYGLEWEKALASFNFKNSTLLLLSGN